MPCLWLTILTLLAAVEGQTATLMTIDEAVREALANNPQIHRQQAYHDAAIFEKNAARADFLPRLSADYAYQNLAEAPFVNIYGNQVITNSRDQHHWNLTLRQPLFSGFSIRARHRLAELGVASRELELHQTRQTLVLQAKQHCFELLMAEKTLQAAKRSTTALSAHEADVRMFHNNGLVPANDLLKAQVARAEAVQQQHRAAASRDQARTALSLLLGRDYDSDIAVADLVVTDPHLPELSAMIDRALIDRPEVALLQQSIRSTSEELVLARSDYYPHIDATGRYQQDGDDLGARSNTYTNQYNASVGIEARWTLFEFGKTRAAAAAVAARQRALEQTLESMRDEVRLQVVKAHLDLDVAARNIGTATTALEQAREHWRITNLLYQQQLATSTEVLDARSYHDRAQNAYHDAHYGYGAAMATLAWAVGSQQ